jgi:hypothetical protein
MASEVHRKSPSGAKARMIGAGSGTAEAAPFPLLHFGMTKWWASGDREREDFRKL